MPEPAFLGRRVLADVALADLVPYIDWTFFFSAWELKGRFPAILDHPQQGPAARELYENAQALQNRIDMLWTDFVNRGDPVQQRAIEQERNKALAELDALKKEIDEQTKAVAGIEVEARRAGVPAGWLRDN